MAEISPDIDDLLSSSEPDREFIINALVEEYRTALYRLAESILRDPDEANDAVQETFIEKTAGDARLQAGEEWGIPPFNIVRLVV